MIIPKLFKLCFSVFKCVKVGVKCLFSEGLTPTTSGGEKVNLTTNDLVYD